MKVMILNLKYYVIFIKKILNWIPFNLSTTCAFLSQKYFTFQTRLSKLYSSIFQIIVPSFDKIKCSYFKKSVYILQLTNAFRKSRSTKLYNVTSNVHLLYKITFTYISFCLFFLSFLLCNVRRQKSLHFVLT